MEIQHRAARDRVARHVVVIPRSAANLADVVQRILQDFQGEATARLRTEVQRHRGLSESEARQRVLDELAISLENMQAAEGEDEETRYLRQMLPAFLRDHEIRRALSGLDGSIVHRLARHVLGKRESAEPEELRWLAADFDIPITAIDKAGADAGELASGLLNDDRLRDTATRLLQRAQGPAIAALLRFRSGDLKRALNEIRAQLAEQSRELVLLLEDLSITEGLDGELLEALQVRTHDSGARLCTLRSIVGLTREDHQRLRDNIKGRLTRVLWFDVPIGQGTASSEDAALSEFAARYLNAVRLSSHALNEWVAHCPGVPAPNACEDCPRRGGCHDAFGMVGGLGLFPLSSVALGRLYRRVVRSDGGATAFKPRALIRVLSDTLDEAERGLPRGEFPTAALIQSFGLGSTTSEVQIALRKESGIAGDRILRAIEFYAAQPAVARPVLSSGIQASLGLQGPSWLLDTSGGDTSDAVDSSSQALGPNPAPAPVAPAPEAPPAPEPALDLYDRWKQGEDPSDRAVNSWRQVVLDAVRAAIDWDVEGLAFAWDSFRAVNIQIEGQTTRTTDPILVVSRTPEVALTLRILSESASRQAANAEMLMLTARIQIESWTAGVRQAIHRRAFPSGGVDAIAVGTQLLALGAFVCGRGTRTGAEGPLLDHCMRTDWDPELGRGRGGAWNSLLRAYTKLGPKVQSTIHNVLSCTKGGQAGAFLDASPVIATIREVRKGPLPSFAFDDSVNWGVFRDIGSLAREVSQHLSAAVDEELKTASDWRQRVTTILGDDSPAEVLVWIAEALDAASDVGLGDNQARRLVADLQGRPVKGCLDSVDKVLAATDGTGQLLALGGLDWNLMKELLDALDAASKSLADLESRLRQRVQDAHGGKTSEDLVAEIADRLARIEAAYRELSGTEERNG